MTRRFVRLTLFAVLLFALTAAAYRLVTLDRAQAAIVTQADAMRAAAASALDALLELRAAERAYVAEGQAATYWRDRAARASERLQENVEQLRAGTAGSQAGLSLASADEELTRLKRLETRIGDHALAGRRHHAEDLVFADAIQASTAVERSLRAVSADLVAASESAARDLRQQELIVLALAAAIALLVALLLVPVPAASETAPEQPAADPGHELGLRLREPLPARPNLARTGTGKVTETRPQTPAARATTRAQLEAARDAERAAAARLQAAADLCTALARVTDSRDLSTLLAHVNRILAAQGTIVWLANGEGTQLEPVLAHGYRDDVLKRMGMVAVDAEIPAADAFRRREARVVEPSGGAPGAIIVPLLSAAGCAGVLTAELGRDVAPDAVTLAIARIFASQLATFVAPPAPPEAETPQSAATQAV